MIHRYQLLNYLSGLPSQMFDVVLARFGHPVIMDEYALWNNYNLTLLVFDVQVL